MSDACEHKNLRPEVVDQTAGVVCADCDTLLCHCWGSNHAPESTWNKACDARPDIGKRAEKNRDNVCFLCGKQCEKYVSRRSPKPRCAGLADSCKKSGYGNYCMLGERRRYRHRCGARIASAGDLCIDCYVLTK